MLDILTTFSGLGDSLLPMISLGILTAATAATVAGTIGTGVLLGTGATAAATKGFGAFKGGMVKKAPPKVEMPSKAQTSAAGEKERKRRRTQTILTSPSGLEDKGLMTLKTLLGE